MTSSVRTVSPLSHTNVDVICCNFVSCTLRSCIACRLLMHSVTIYLCCIHATEASSEQLACCAMLRGMDTHGCQHHSFSRPDAAAQQVMHVVVELQGLHICLNPNLFRVLCLQDKFKLKDIMTPAMYGSYCNIFPHTMAQDPGAAPASSAACISPKRSTQLKIKKQHQLLLTGPPAQLLLEAPTGAARTDVIKTAVVVFAAMDLTVRMDRRMAPPGTLLLPGPAPVLLLTAPAPQLLLTAPLAQLLLEGPPARLLLEGPPAAPPPPITIAVPVFLAEDLTKRARAPSAAVRPLRLTWLAPPPVLLLNWPPRPLLLQAPPTAAAPPSNMTSVAVSASVKKDLALGADRMTMRPQLSAGLRLRPIEPHLRLLLRALPAAMLPATIKTNFAVRPSLGEDGSKQRASMMARPLLLTWPAARQLVMQAPPTAVTQMPAPIAVPKPVMEDAVSVREDDPKQPAHKTASPLPLTWPAAVPARDVPSNAAHPVSPYSHALFCVPNPGSVQPLLLRSNVSLRLRLNASWFSS